MTPETRIEALEKDIMELRTDFDALTKFCIRQGGESATYKTALLALLADNQSEGATRALRDELVKNEAMVVHECMSEDYLEGVQEAQKLILLALEQSVPHPYGTSTLKA